MNHRIGRNLFALAVGLAVAVLAFQWITNPEPRAERAKEERVVEASRSLLATIIVSDGLEIVDPLDPNRKVGKVYVYAEDPGWAISGYYRRNEADRWHPYLMTMTEDMQLSRLKVQDSGLSPLTDGNPRIEVRP